jgi:hypothetical protein
MSRDLSRAGAAALLGAVLAVTALSRTRTVDHWPVIIAIMLAAAVAVPLAATALRPDPTVPPASRPAPPPAPARAAAPPAPVPARAAAPAAPTPRQWYDQPAATVAVPVRPDTWWDAAPRAAEPEQGEPPPDPAERAVTRVVQCPACGDFAVDLRQRDAGFAFECRGCGHGWQWRPGTPWPAAVVRPRRRRQSPG